MLVTRNGGHDILNRNRLLLIGIDGASYSTINDLLSTDRLPNLKRIASGGIFSPLASTLPVHAASGWTSALTGNNPGKHDVYDFYGRMNGSYRRSLINDASVKAKTLCSVLNDYGKKSIIMNLPITVPPDSINGINIGGMLSIGKDKFTHPAFLSEDLRKIGYTIDALQDIDNNTGDFINSAYRTMELRQKVFLNLLEKNDWDFAAIDFTTIDRLQLTIWEEQETIRDFYIKLDELLGDIFKEMLDDRTQVILFSSYGFKSIAKKFFVNEWLWELGLLKKWISPKPGTIPDFWDDNFFQSKNERKITSFLTKTRITKDNINRLIPKMLSEMIKNRTPVSLRKIFPKENLIIDWSQTRAYLTSQFSQGININLKGREPNGIVNPGEEYEKLRNEIIRELYRLEDPFTLNSVIDEAHRGEDVFQGEFSKYAPDIVFVPSNYDYVLRPGKRTNSTCISNANDLYPILSGPEPEGFLLINGEGIRGSAERLSPKIYDIFPTALELLGLPESGGTDGKNLLPLVDVEEYGSDLSLFENSGTFGYALADQKMDR